MAEEKNFNPQQQEEEEGINLYALIFKYLIYWPWFVASILVCLIGAYVYLRYQTPVYNVKSAVLIKEQDRRRQMNNNAFAAIQDMGMLSMTNNFDNEIHILQSHTMVKKVVSDLELYINHSKERNFAYNQPLYKNEPVKVYMNPEEADKLESVVKIQMNYDTNRQLKIKVEYTKEQEKKEFTATIKQLPTAYPTEIGVLTFTPDTTIVLTEPVSLTATITTPTAATSNYCTNLSVSPTSKTTTIAQINVKNTIKQRGIDFIYRLIEVYNQDANDEKNEVAQKTAEFIEERISIINKELSSTEDDLASFKQRSRLTDLTSDAQMALQETSRYEQQLNANATQINLVQYLQTYINTPANADEVIPANVGLEDQNLANVI
ncbi:MAG: tyrosine protein kinase, partial [Bacteroides sp.]|nr:tyrosine protein kinase [Bacteroides sp.]